MGRDLRTGAAALLIFTILLGFGYSLALTGISQAVFGDNADGSQVTHDGQVVGSELLGQDFSIGYLDHSRDAVELYLEESMTVKIAGAEAAVQLAYDD